MNADSWTDRLDRDGKIDHREIVRGGRRPVYDADAAVHQLYEGEAAPAIEAAFPGTTVDGKVDRAKLSAQRGARSRRDQAARADRSSDARRLPAEIFCRCRAVRGAGRGAGYSAAVRNRRREAGRCRGRGHDLAGSSARACSGARQHDEAKSSTRSWRGRLPDAEKRKRADFVVDTSHGLDPVRAQIPDILAEVVKMPQRRA